MPQKNFLNRPLYPMARDAIGGVVGGIGSTDWNRALHAPISELSGMRQSPLARQSKPLGAEYDLTNQYTRDQGQDRLAGYGYTPGFIQQNLDRPESRVAGSSVLSELPASTREPIVPVTRGALSNTQRSLRQVNELANQRPEPLTPLGEGDWMQQGQPSGQQAWDMARRRANSRAGTASPWAAGMQDQSLQQRGIEDIGGGADQRRAEYDALQAEGAARAAGVEEEQIRRNRAIRDGLQRDAMGDAAGPMAYGPDATGATVAEGREIGAQQDARYTGMRGRMNAQPGTPLETEDTLRGGYNQNYRPGIDDPSTRYPTYQRNPNQAADMAQGMQDVAERKQGRMRVVVDKDTGELLQPAAPGSDAQKRYEQGTEISLDDYQRMRGNRSPGAPEPGEEGPVGYNRSEVPQRIVPQTGEVIGSSDPRWNAAVDPLGGKPALLDRIQRDRARTQAWRDDPDKGGGMSSALKKRLENKDRALKRNMLGKPIYNKKGKLIGRRPPTIGLGEYVDSMSKVEGGKDYLAAQGIPAGAAGAAPPDALGSGANPDRPALAGPSQAQAGPYEKSEFGVGYKPESMEAARGRLTNLWTGTNEQDKAQRGVLSSLDLDANSTREDYLSAMTPDRWRQYDKLDDATKFQKASALVTALQAMNVLSGEDAGKGLGMDTVMRVRPEDQKSVLNWMKQLKKVTREPLKDYEKSRLNAPIPQFDESSDVLPQAPSTISVPGPDGRIEAPLQPFEGPTFQPPAAGVNPGSIQGDMSTRIPELGVPDYLQPPEDRAPQAPGRGGPLAPGFELPPAELPDMVVPGIGDDPNLWDDDRNLPEEWKQLGDDVMSMMPWNHDIRPGTLRYWWNEMQRRRR